MKASGQPVVCSQCGRTLRGVMHRPSARAVSIESDPLVARTGKRGPWHVMKPYNNRTATHTAICGRLWRWASDHASSVGPEESRCKQPGCAAAWAKIDAGKVKR